MSSFYSALEQPSIRTSFELTMKSGVEPELSSNLTPSSHGFDSNESEAKRKRVSVFREAQRLNTLLLWDDFQTIFIPAYLLPVPSTWWLSSFRWAMQGRPWSVPSLTVLSERVGSEDGGH